VEFRDGGSDLHNRSVVQAAAAVDGTGHKTYATSSLSAGSHTIRACYAGSGLIPSQGSVSQTVNAAPLDITANNQSKNYGVLFTFTGSEFSTGAGQLKNSDAVSSVNLDQRRSRSVSRGQRLTYANHAERSGRNRTHELHHRVPRRVARRSTKPNRPALRSTPRV
jgi:hypothetical protein